MLEAGLPEDSRINAAGAAEEVYLRFRLDSGYLLRHCDSGIYMSPGPPSGKEKPFVGHNLCLLASSYSKSLPEADAQCKRFLGRLDAKRRTKKGPIPNESV
jgi:hypothetical protein